MLEERHVRYREHEGFKRTFKNNKLTLGLFIPFDNKQQNNIDFDAQVRLAQKRSPWGLQVYL